MTKKKFAFSGFAAATIAAAALIFATSCSKDNNPGEQGEFRSSTTFERPIVDKDVQKRLLELKGMLPTVVVYNSTMEKYISLDLNNPKSFSFTAPGGGLSFSSPSGSVEFVAAGNGSYVILTSPASSGGGGGGGTVSAGNITLDINYVLCFASGDPNSELNFFDLGPSGTSFSGAFGIAGDFEALSTGEIDEDDVFSYFQGWVAYFAFSGQPSGNFPVIDFFDFEEDEVDFNNKGLAYMLSFQPNSSGIFFSKSGQLTFGGSSVDFNGTYYGVTGFLFEFDDDEDDDLEFVEVSGSGVLECGA